MKFSNILRFSVMGIAFALCTSSVYASACPKLTKDFFLEKRDFVKTNAQVTNPGDGDYASLAGGKIRVEGASWDLIFMNARFQWLERANNTRIEERHREIPDPHRSDAKRVHCQYQVVGITHRGGFVLGQLSIWALKGPQIMTPPLPLEEKALKK